MSTRVKVKYVFLTFVPYFVLYYLIQSFITGNHYNLLTFADTQIPFIPEFVWIYHTLVPVTIFTCLLLFQKKELFLSITYSNIVAGTVLCLFYIFLPSFYPREPFVDTSTLSGLLVEFTRSIDGAHNTFPSGHVTFSWLLAFFVGLSQKSKQYSILKNIYFLWAALISLSTLTLKQHYLIDVVFGIALASVIFYVFRKVFLFRRSKNLVILDDKFLPTRSVAKEVYVDCRKHIERKIC